MTASDSPGEPLQRVLARLLGERVKVVAASLDQATGAVNVTLRLPELPSTQLDDLRAWVTERLALAEVMTLSKDGFAFCPKFV